MNDVVRTTVAAAVGATMTMIVMIGQPALADQVDKAKAKKVTSAAIKNGTIQRKDLNADVNGALARADSALQGVPDGSITTFKLASSAVTNPTIADNAVNSAKILDNAVSSAKIADNAVTSSEIADNAIAASELADNAVGSAEVASDSLGSADLASGSVGSSEVSDHSLRLSDFAVASGSLTYDFPNIGPNSCLVSSGVYTAMSLENAIILVENDRLVAGNIQLAARPTSTITSLEIVACNAGSSDVNPPQVDYTWAVLN